MEVGHRGQRQPGSAPLHGARTDHTVRGQVHQQAVLRLARHVHVDVAKGVLWFSWTRTGSGGGGHRVWINVQVVVREADQVLPLLVSVHLDGDEAVEGALVAGKDILVALEDHIGEPGGGVEAVHRGGRRLAQLLAVSQQAGLLVRPVLLVGGLRAVVDEDALGEGDGVLEALLQGGAAQSARGQEALVEAALQRAKEAVLSRGVPLDDLRQRLGHRSYRGEGAATFSSRNFRRVLLQ